MKLIGLIKKYDLKVFNIRELSDGYEVFTIPTQHFKIKHLDELTYDTFDRVIRDLEAFREMERKMWNAAFEKEI